MKGRADMGSCVARQPIFNKRLEIYGYELLFRESLEGTAYRAGLDGNMATSETIMNSFHELGIDRVTNGKRAFINFTEKLLIDEVATILPNNILVVEILENILPTPEIMKVCHTLKNKGYMLALDDFIIEPAFFPFLELADIVKIDFLSTPIYMIDEFARKMKKARVRLLAEKVETHEDFETAKSLGFTLFQGHFFSKPVIVPSGTKISPSKLHCTQLIRLVYDRNADFDKISEVIKQDIALSYKLLKVINSAYFGLRYSVNNIRHALAILGLDEIKKWVTLISLSQMTEGKPDELITISLIRAKFLEQAGKKIGGLNTDELFMIGLMSLMDVIIGLTLEEIIDQTHISESIAFPLLTKTGAFGELLSLIEHYESCHWEESQELAEKHGLSIEQVQDLYVEAIEWAAVPTS